MQRYIYDKKKLKITKLRALYSGILIRFAKTCVLPQTRKLLYKLLGVKFGADICLSPNIDIIDYSLGKYLSLGDRVALAPNITFVISSGPSESKLKKLYPKIYGPITIEEDVWIGTGVIILPGITIGKCSIIGSGSIVTRDIPPFSVAVGNPARVIKKIDVNKI